MSPASKNEEMTPETLTTGAEMQDTHTTGTAFWKTVSVLHGILTYCVIQ